MKNKDLSEAVGEIANAAVTAISALAIASLADKPDKMQQFSELCRNSQPIEGGGELYDQFMRQMLSSIDHTLNKPS